MRDSGYYAQKNGSPTGFILVVLLHVAVLSAIILIKGPAFVRLTHPNPQVYNLPLPRDPDPDPPPPQREQPQQQSRMDHPETVINLPDHGPATQTTQDPPPTFTLTRVGPIELARAELPPPVRRDATVDPAYSGFLQPPYPPSEIRLGHEGDVRVLVTIGTNGRVIAIERLSATSDAFWAVTQRQALSRWRFRPATVDGRPVESTKVMNLHFQLDEA